MKVKLLILIPALLILAAIAVPVLAKLDSPPLISVNQTTLTTPVDTSVPFQLNSTAQISKSIPSTAPGAQAVDAAGIQALVNDTGGAAVSIDSATGAASFVRLTPAQADRLARQLATGGSFEAQATAFFNEYGRIFGIQDVNTELNLVDTRTDSLGTTHLIYKQVYNGVPVFAGWVQVHFNANNQITAVNGTFVPNIRLNTQPSISGERAAQIAVGAVASQKVATGLTARRNILYVFRANLARGIPGANHLVYEVEVTDGRNIRELVYVDAHTARIVDQIDLIPEALDRNVYSGTFTAGALVWEEGDPLPYTGVFSEDINNLIDGSKESYDFLFEAFGRDSYDGNGASMNTVNNDPTIFCPNANWNGVTTNYCNGVTADDVVAHEWGHAVTQFTSNLLYQWQPGALNESFSDVMGEIVDRINNRGSDAPGGPRTNVNACSVFSPPRQFIRVNSPASIAGNYATAGADFGPPLTPAGVTGDLVLVDDGDDEGGDGSTDDGCQSLVNGGAVNGNIALMTYGPCDVEDAIDNAEDSGAIGAIVIAPSDLVLLIEGISPPPIAIPSGEIGERAGNDILDRLEDGPVNVTMREDNTPAQNSYRWLLGEDATAFNGALRDMWNPTCYRDPGKVSDSQYHCTIDDNGGVHINSGIPNHAFALVVDGGSYNGQTITGLGLTKAAHIYWRAQDVYQTEASDFIDHADALEQSCSDLVGTNLKDLVTGNPSGQIISAANCNQVAKAVQAVELRKPPTQCNFQPLLAQNTPAFCEGEAYTEIFLATFETPATTTWTLANQGVFSEYIPRNWRWVANLPQNRTGHAFFAFDDPNLGDCTPGSDDQSGVVRLISPKIKLPTHITPTNIQLAFDHNMASEPGWDGGNLKISVNGGAFTLVPASRFTFNAYMAVTSCPARVKLGSNWWPMTPVAPAIKIFIVLPP
jgi:Zn-dependent metalloprotease